MSPKSWIVCLLLVLHLLCWEAATEKDSDVSAESAEGDAEDENVLPEVLLKLQQKDGAFILNDTTFDGVVDWLRFMMVLFYAPWCEHCRRVAPDFHAAAKKLRKRDEPIYSGIIDIAENKILPERFNITSVPWLKVIKHGKILDYLGERSSPEIVKFMEKVAEPDWEYSDDLILTLDLETFERAVTQETPSFILLIAPDCVQCNTMIQIFKITAESLKDKNIQTNLGIFDADKYYDNITILKDYDIPGYPGFVTTRLGFIRPYYGSSDVEAVKDYIIHLTDPDATLVTSPRQLDKYTSVGNVYVVGFFETESDAKLQHFKRVAAEFRDQFPFGYCLDEECRKGSKVKPGDIAIFIPERLRSKHDQSMKILDEDYDAARLKTFLQDHQFPLVGEHHTYNRKAYMKRRPLCLVILEVDWSFDFRAVTTKWHRRVAEIAKDYPNITFVLGDETGHQYYLKHFGLDFSPEEINIGILGENYTVYPMAPMEDSFDSDKVREFLDDFNRGKLTPTYYNDMAYETRDLVVAVNDSTFESVVMDPSKDVLIEFYDPECTACHSFAPIYRKVAVAYRAMENVVVARMDAVANQVPPLFTLKHYPTIFLVPTSNNPRLYDGSYSIDDLVHFMEKHSPVVGMARNNVKIEL